MREAGLERVHFAWAGPLEPGRAHYYRLHGPTLLIEYDNTQNNANHIHSVWHDPAARLRPRPPPRPLRARPPSRSRLASPGGGSRSARRPVPASDLPRRNYRPAPAPPTFQRVSYGAARGTSLALHWLVPDVARSIKPFVIVAGVIAGVAALYLARGLLIPIALAILLTFMVHPMVGWLTRLGLGRALSVGVVVTMLFATLGGVAWMVTTEVAVLSVHIPAYRDNLIAKIAHVRAGTRRHDREGADRGERRSPRSCRRRRPRPRIARAAPPRWSCSPGRPASGSCPP